MPQKMFNDSENLLSPLKRVEEEDCICKNLTVVVDNIVPYISVHENNNTISGYMAELWSIMEETLQFKSKFIRAQFADGKRLLIEGSVDAVLTPIVVTSTDVDQFDYSFPVAKNWYELYSKRNGNAGATCASYIETWSPKLWMAFLSTIFVLSLSLWFTMKMRKKFGLDEPAPKNPGVFLSDWRRKCRNIDELTSTDVESNSFFSCFFTVLGIVTNQGFNVDTKSSSLRIIVLVILFFGLLMLNSYSAVLVSRLAVDKADILFPNLESIAEQKGYVLCVRENSFAYRNFKKRENDVDLLPSWRRVVNQPPCSNISTVEKIADVLCDDRTVVLESPHVVASILESRKCVATRMPGRYATAYTAILLRKNLKIKEKINYTLQKLLSNGIIDYLQNKWLHRRLPESHQLSSITPVTINHINGVLALYWLAIIVSLGLMLLQKLVTWKRQNTEINLSFFE